MMRSLVYSAAVIPAIPHFYFLLSNEAGGDAVQIICASLNHLEYYDGQTVERKDWLKYLLSILSSILRGSYVTDAGRYDIQTGIVWPSDDGCKVNGE